jgi:hypothetical protein
LFRILQWPFQFHLLKTQFAHLQTDKSHPFSKRTRVKCLLVASNHQEKTWRHPWLFFEKGGLNGVDMLILKAALGQVNRLENPSGTIAGRQ